jgi:ABC-type Fe3+-hydroxamate transport system substrate-binding protein
MRTGFLVAVISACFCSQGICLPLTVKDDRGKEFVFKEMPRRIVSLVPTQTELLYSLGLEKEVVGITTYCNYPETAKQKEKVGGFAEFDIDAIRKTVGSVPDEKRPTVFRVMGIDPPATIGMANFQSDIFYLAGGRNAFADVEKDYFKVDAQELLKRNPDLIVVCGDNEDESKKKLNDSPAFKNLTAVKKDSVLVIPCDLICRPGPRVAETAQSIARALYREKFTDKP